MELFPAIDLFGGQAVRLLRGDYGKMTRYSGDPLAVARGFREQGAGFLHLVDLEGAKSGGQENFEAIRRIVTESGLQVEVGGGVRTLESARRLLELGAFRVVLGTAALDEAFLKRALAEFGEKIAVGVDLKDGRVAVKGWTEVTGEEGFDFCRRMERLGTATLICTDISRDGAMRGANRALYARLVKEVGCRIVASGGVSSLEDVRALAKTGAAGAIIGRALYTGDIRLEEALAATREEEHNAL